MCFFNSRGCSGIAFPYQYEYPLTACSDIDIFMYLIFEFTCNECSNHSNTNFHYTYKKTTQTNSHTQQVQNFKLHMPHAVSSVSIWISTCHSIFSVTSDHCPIGRPTPGRGNFLEASVAFPLQQRREEVIGVKGLWWWSPIWMGRRFPVDKHRFAYLVSMRVHVTEVS